MGKPLKFQISLKHKWTDYYNEENAVLTRAFMSGSKKAKYHLRGNNFEFEKGSSTSMVHFSVEPPGGTKGAMSCWSNSTRDRFLGLNAKTEGKC